LIEYLTNMRRFYLRAFWGRKNKPGPTSSGYGVLPSAVSATFIGTASAGIVPGWNIVALHTVNDPA